MKINAESVSARELDNRWFFFLYNEGRKDSQSQIEIHNFITMSTVILWS